MSVKFVFVAFRLILGLSNLNLAYRSNASLLIQPVMGQTDEKLHDLVECYCSEKNLLQHLMHQIVSHDPCYHF